MKKNIFLYIFILVLLVSCAKNPNQEEGKKTDSTSTTGSISPSLNLVDNANRVSLKQVIIIKFSVGIQKLGKIQISQDNITDFVSLREGSRTGEKVTFAAEINEEQKQISITPHSLKNSTRYYFNIDGSQLRGKNGEQVSSKEIQFTTIGLLKPSLNIVDNASEVALNEKIMIQFSVSMQKIGGKAITKDNAQDFVSLREGSRTGAKVAFAAEINEEQKQISITPHSLKNSTRYYFNIDGSQLRGKNGEQVSNKEIQFTTISQGSTGSISPSLNSYR